MNDKTLSTKRTLLRSVARNLRLSYPVSNLGNKLDPTKEIFFILLSARTTETLYRAAYRNLFTHFRNIRNIAKAHHSTVFNRVRVAGLGKKRTKQIIQTARRLLEDFGHDPSTGLKKLNQEEVFSYLSSLPGIGPKSAFCVMMYSLGFDVFPVDVHVRRISERLGVITPFLRPEKAQTRLAPIVPRGHSYDLHVLLVQHGRSICTPRKPKCNQCDLANDCTYNMRNN